MVSKRNKRKRNNISEIKPKENKNKERKKKEININEIVSACVCVHVQFGFFFLVCYINCYANRNWCRYITLNLVILNVFFCFCSFFLVCHAINIQSSRFFTLKKTTNFPFLFFLDGRKFMVLNVFIPETYGVNGVLDFKVVFNFSPKSFSFPSRFISVIHYLRADFFLSHLHSLLFLSLSLFYSLWECVFIFLICFATVIFIDQKEPEYALSIHLICCDGRAFITSHTKLQNISRKRKEEKIKRMNVTVTEIVRITLEPNTYAFHVLSIHWWNKTYTKLFVFIYTESKMVGAVRLCYNNIYKK